MRSNAIKLAIYAGTFIGVFVLVLGGLIGVNMMFGRDLDTVFGRDQEWPEVCDENGACVWLTSTPPPTPLPATAEAIATFYAERWATHAAATAVVVGTIQPVAEDGQ